ncbi:MAG: ABC transporter substrate-binding protein [Anaeromyxobacter sp.]|nr:ABC transporter substrate-binding protein [Anaeromyxobacter sp.]MBL0274657.1 ABC transporter substrate-binding protein [Anaeromyxobacter sp.]
MRTSFGLAAALALAAAPFHAAAADDLVFGMSAPFSGAAKELGRSMKVGIDVAFAAVNEAGGVHGRRLRLAAMDDGYDPARALAAVKALREKYKVMGYLGNVGSQAAAEMIPWVLDQRLLLFGTLSGSRVLRQEPPDRYVFNFRPSYMEETIAAVKYLVEVRRVRPADIAVFYQEDGFGEAGLEGVQKALRRYRVDPAQALRLTYKRNSADVDEAVKALKRHGGVKAVVMVATYKAAARFIAKARGAGLEPIFTNVSPVGSTELADELLAAGPGLADGVVVTQVVPLPTSGATAILRYREALKRWAPDEPPDFLSLEGYVMATLLVEGLRRAGPGADVEKLVEALEQLQGLDLGIGAPLSFGPSEHQASHRLWGTVLDAKGKYRTIDLE